jgi:hypothetical protein
MSFLPSPIVTHGGVSKVNCTDIDVRDLLEDVLKELQKMNLQFSIVTDLNIENKELT